MVKYTSKDLIRVVWKPQTEANYGTKALAGDTPAAFPSHIYELTPMPQPHVERILVLRGEAATHAIPISLLSHYMEYALRISLYQPTMTWANSWQKPMLSEVATNSNFWIEAQIKRDASNLMFIQLWGIKPNIVSIRCAKDQKIQWILD